MAVRLIRPGLPVGAIFPMALAGGLATPFGYLPCDGAAVSRATYNALWAVVASSATVTITIASPGVVTWTGHTLSDGHVVRFSTTDTLPTGLSAGTDYYVVNSAADTFQVSATKGGAAINTSGAQAGTHTATHAPYGHGDGSTTFNVPDLGSSVILGEGQGSGLTARLIAEIGGAETHTLTESEIPGHTHSLSAGSVSIPSAREGGTIQIDGDDCLQSGDDAESKKLASGSDPTSSFSVTGSAGSTGGDGAHENMPPFVVARYVIRARP